MTKFVRFPRFAAAAILLVLVSGCGAGDTSPAVASTPEELLANLIAADNAGDLPAVLACYAADAVLLPPDGSPVEGIEKIEEHYAEVFRTSEISVRAEPGNTRDEGAGAVTMGFLLGTARPRSGGDPHEFHWRFVIYARRDHADRWKITRFLWDPVEAAQS